MFTTGQICVRLGVLPWHINRAIARGYLPEPQRIGCYRVWQAEDLPRVREALVQAGYLEGEEAGVC